MIRWYLRALEKKPTITMAISTATLMSTGDVLAQTAIEKRHQHQNYQPIRTLRFFVFGLTIAGPSLRLWYKTLDKIIPAGAALRPLKMVALDQILFAPCFLTVFWTTMGILRGETFTEVLDSLKKNGLSVLLSNYKLWPAVQLINFYWVPLQHRVLAANTVALGWNTYLAWKAENQNHNIK
ncbi:MPV17 [Bugula neritina]|uniref:Mitochondrial inner membrane protein Mpv17 n=1 Tax=Bugula neritina TaxID=10212 RepID=A0A7J7J4H1_BUGNE|nr:MPV17 [Bugula neritina]